MHPIQALIDGLGQAGQRERANSDQMILGELIARLEALPESVSVALGSPHSYRGYYIDLSFERTPEPRPVADVLADARSCLGKVFEGYKGGDYTMGKSTPVWCAGYGNCGQKITAINDDGSLVLRDDDDD